MNVYLYHGNPEKKNWYWDFKGGDWIFSENRKKQYCFSRAKNDQEIRLMSILWKLVKKNENIERREEIEKQERKRERGWRARKGGIGNKRGEQWRERKVDTKNKKARGERENGEREKDKNDYEVRWKKGKNTKTFHEISKQF